MLRAVQTLLDDGIAEPILVGRREVIEQRVRELGLRMDLNGEVRVVDPEQDEDVHRTRLVASRRSACCGRMPRRAAGRGGAADAQPPHRHRGDAVADRGQLDAATMAALGDWWRAHAAA